jgi:hypothetical protein
MTLLGEIGLFSEIIILIFAALGFWYYVTMKKPEWWYWLVWAVLLISYLYKVAILGIWNWFDPVVVSLLTAHLCFQLVPWLQHRWSSTGEQQDRLDFEQLSSELETSNGALILWDTLERYGEPLSRNKLWDMCWGKLTEADADPEAQSKAFQRALDKATKDGDIIEIEPSVYALPDREGKDQSV